MTRTTTEPKPPRRAWEPPQIKRIAAASAENGVLIGQEALILLS